jgi:hypothetical protein
VSDYDGFDLDAAYVELYGRATSDVADDELVAALDSAAAGRVPTPTLAPSQSRRRVRVEYTPESRVRPVVQRRKVFTVSHLAEAAGLSATRALEFLEGFAEVGLVERTRGGWRLTDEGRSVTSAFATSSQPPEEIEFE